MIEGRHLLLHTFNLFSKKKIVSMIDCHACLGVGREQEREWK